MKEVYGIEFGEFRQFAALRLRYDALSQKQIDVANGFATDWQIAAEKFAALDDDKKLFPPYYPRRRRPPRGGRQPEDRRSASSASAR